MVVYADTYFLINAFVDLLLILCTAQICAVRIRWGRMAAASAAGGLYAVLTLIRPLAFLNLVPMKLCTGTLMVLIAFGREQTLLRMELVFMAVSAAFGGSMFALALAGGNSPRPMSFRIAVPAACIIYGVLTIVFKRTAAGRGNGGIAEVEVTFQGRKIIFPALQDTGNSLTDPFTGAPVIITDYMTIKEIFPREMQEIFTVRSLRNAPEAMRAAADLVPSVRFRLLPYKTVGTAAGLLCAFKPDRVVINGQDLKGCLVAISPEPVSDGGAYSALAGAKI